MGHLLIEGLTHANPALALTFVLPLFRCCPLQRMECGLLS